MARSNPSTTNSTRRSGSFSATRPSGRTWYCTVQGIPASRNSSPASPPTGEVSDPHYFFSISDMALTQRPWRSGVVYLLPAGSFETQPPLAVGDVRVQVAQAASPVPVTPVAKLMVDPSDFPFLEEIRGHDDELLQTRIAADPTGFPWVEEHAGQLR